MRNTGKLFAAGLRQIARDGMLLVLVPAPLFAGLFFFCRMWYTLVRRGGMRLWSGWCFMWM